MDRTCKEGDRRSIEGRGEMKYTIQPITLLEANEFIKAHHRHHGKVQGHKFSIALNDGQEIIGVAVIGRPVARVLVNGWTLEVTRLCVLEGFKDACSMLYAAAWRATRALEPVPDLRVVDRHRRQ